MRLLLAERNQKAAGSLGIVKQGRDFVWHGAQPLDRRGSEIAVVGQAPGQGPLAGVVHGAGKEPNAVDCDFQGHVARERHFARVADEPEARDVGATVHLEGQHGFAGGAV